MTIKDVKDILGPDFDKTSDQTIEKLVDLLKAYSCVIITDHIKDKRELTKAKYKKQPSL